ncbi:MAG: hypothetical protein ACSHX6_02320 [Akkermansiaceae bacterium]
MVRSFEWSELGAELDALSTKLGGNSGGAWRAFYYCACIEYKWAGIYFNGGWLGGPKYHDLGYSKNMRVVMVNGNNDHANRVNDKVTEILHSHDGTVAMISFEGGHQIPTTRPQIKAFKWLTDLEGVEDK